MHVVLLVYQEACLILALTGICQGLFPLKHQQFPQLTCVPPAESIRHTQEFKIYAICQYHKRIIIGAIGKKLEKLAQLFT
jgi:hypothetical protein